ncbi:hypothetical protein AVEN_239085-1 [Araneus ventricosus]|uniref:BTB domain-containing protein n=1 Tax=Araneus ventricosus TaxID=182803 RepID=A0A4Y2FP16_ARAVE|nr:hypothetical protein AVEN_239085-1 [Araneus ventricosus]
MISNAMKTNFSSKENHTECSTTLMVLYDTKLKTATETFPAHILVLSERSSVFKSMFSTDTKEKTNNYVNINDLDADTVSHMLLFMYSDTFDDLIYDRIKNLYFAADKYNIVSLRLMCSSFLKQNLLQSNYCEILLANKHQDNDLKYAIQDKIMKNDDVILFSHEWTTKVLRNLYIKSRRI